MLKSSREILSGAEAGEAHTEEAAVVIGHLLCVERGAMQSMIPPIIDDGLAKQSKTSQCD